MLRPVVQHVACGRFINETDLDQRSNEGVGLPGPVHGKLNVLGAHA